MINIPGRLSSVLQLLTENLKFSQKGLLLIALPLFFELIFVIAPMITLVQSDQEIARAAKAKDIVKLFRDLDIEYIQLNTWLIRYAVTLNDKYSEQVDLTIKEYESNLARLNKLLATDHEGAETFRRMYVPRNEIMKLLHQGKELVSMGLAVDATPLLIKQRFIIETLQDIEHDYLDRNSRLAVRSPRAIRRETQDLVLLLATTMLINLFVAVLLSLFFSRGISKRLLFVHENASRFANNRALLPALRGSDEIAGLDNVFHLMTSAVAESRRKESAAVNTTAEAIFSLDGQFRFIVANQTTLKLWNLKEAELVGKLFFDLLLEDDRQSAMAALQKVQERKEALSFESRTFFANNLIQDFIWHVLWSDSEQSYFFVARNISEQKQLELVRKEFVSMVSHDLRSPLTSMQLGLDVLDAGYVGNLDEAGLLLVRKAKGDVEILLKLVNDLLLFERMESGKVTVELDSVELEQCIERAIETMQKKLQRQGIVLRRSGKTGMAYADSTCIVQVVQQLLDNAIKSSNTSNEICLEVEEGNGFYEVKIIDHGYGLSEEISKLIFEPYRPGKGDNAILKNLGFGLPLCKAIVDAHGGEIGVLSELGKGSTYWFRIKKYAAAPRSAQTEARRSQHL